MAWLSAHARHMFSTSRPKRRVALCPQERPPEHTSEDGVSQQLSESDKQESENAAARDVLCAACGPLDDDLVEESIPGLANGDRVKPMVRAGPGNPGSGPDPSDHGDAEAKKKPAPSSRRAAAPSKRSPKPNSPSL